MKALDTPVPKHRRKGWLNRTVLGIGLASFFSDWSHEIATAVMPALLATLGASAFWLGLIEGVADGLSSAAKMLSGYYTDRLRRRKPIALAGYLTTAVATASFGLAGRAWHVLLARSIAWLGRGVRTPVRKALMSASVEAQAYGRAFGFERMMDTLGAIVGPACAFFLLRLLDQNYSLLFALTLIPGLLSALMIGLLVREEKREKVAYLPFRDSLKGLPFRFRFFLVGVGLFGLGDFSHTLLILLAVEQLTPLLGGGGAASTAVVLYVMHNLCYAGFSFASGWMADRTNKGYLLAAGYALASLMTLVVLLTQPAVLTLALVFILGGIYVAVEETLEDSFCAELTRVEQHGMAFGTLATVNGVGDFVSSLVVGALWSMAGIEAAMLYSLALFSAGSLLIFKLAKPAKGDFSQTG